MMRSNALVHFSKHVVWWYGYGWMHSAMYTEKKRNNLCIFILLKTFFQFKKQMYLKEEKTTFRKEMRSYFTSRKLGMCKYSVYVFIFEKVEGVTTFDD